MEKLEIITNNIPRQFVCRADVPGNVLVEDFDHLSGDEAADGFFCYRGVWYHISDFMRIENHPDKGFSSWHGYHSDSFFSGVLIRIGSDCETFVVGRYFS